MKKAAAAAAKASTSKQTAGEGSGVTAPPFVLLDDRLTPGKSSVVFENPVDILRCDDPESAEGVLDDLKTALERGLSAAGFLSYELGYLLEPKLAPLLPARRDQPLIWMGIFDKPRYLDQAAVDSFLAARRGGGHRMSDQRLSITRAEYLRALARVKDYILAGDVYQINLTFKYLFNFAGDPLSLYDELRRKQRVAHGAVIHGEDFDVLSLSPELFISVREGKILAKPMKGTARRRPTAALDAAERDWLRGDEKSRAENLMIVDLLRNDLSRAAEIGSLEVPSLFEVETYQTVHQMTSSVRAALRPATGLRDLIQCLFPCGSVTGAPKHRAMEIIRELEPAPRGIYTGAIGMLGPEGQTEFNVAIRTLMLHRDGRGEMGIGSGVVYDSQAEAEYEECLLKARFLTDPFDPFRLLETMAWRPHGGHDLLDFHLERLAASAKYFGFPCGIAGVRRALLERAREYRNQDMRVRLTLGEDGDIEVEETPLPRPDPKAVLRYAVGENPIDRDSPFFYHKTTRRGFFDRELALAQAASNCDEVILVNERGELTEGTWTNLFIERHGRLLTPPLDCGLLDGTLRRSLLDEPERAAEVRVLYPEDLRDAAAVYLGNSVRGLVRALPGEPKG